MLYHPQNNLVLERPCPHNHWRKKNWNATLTHSPICGIEAKFYPQTRVFYLQARVGCIWILSSKSEFFVRWKDWGKFAVLASNFGPEVPFQFFWVQWCTHYVCSQKLNFQKLKFLNVLLLIIACLFSAKGIDGDRGEKGKNGRRGVPVFTKFSIFWGHTIRIFKFTLSC